MISHDTTLHYTTLHSYPQRLRTRGDSLVEVIRVLLEVVSAVGVRARLLVHAQVVLPLQQQAALQIHGNLDPVCE
jgi:predicted DNA repair protein MutK